MVMPSESAPVSMASGRQMPTWGWVILVVFAFTAGIGIGVAIVPDQAGGNSNASSAPSSAPTYPTSETNSTTTTEGAVVPTPDEFRVDVIVTKQDCFGSAGCNVTYEIKPTYTGSESLKNSSLRVIYQINGGKQPQVGNFTVANGTPHYDRGNSIETDSDDAVLTANVTQVIPN